MGTPPDQHPSSVAPQRKDDPEGGGGSGGTGGPAPSPGLGNTAQVTQASQAEEKSISPADQTTKGVAGRSHRAQSVGTSVSPTAGAVVPTTEGDRLAIIPYAPFCPPPEVTAYMAFATALLSSPLELLDPEVQAYLARQLQRIPGHRGDRRLENVRAPILETGAQRVWVNGKPLRGSAILDTGAMPLLIGRPGALQLGLKKKDILPNAARLALADGKSTQLFGVTKEPIQFTFNPGETTQTTIAVRGVITQAPYDFLLGNVILWVMGGIIDGYREQFRYQVNWQSGSYQANGPEGFIPLTYERDPNPTSMTALHVSRPNQGGGSGWALAGANGQEEPEGGSEEESDPAQDNDDGEEALPELVPDGEQVAALEALGYYEGSGETQPEGSPEDEPEAEPEDHTAYVGPEERRRRRMASGTWDERRRGPAPEVPYPPPDLAGVILRGDTRGTAPEDEPVWDWDANPTGGWYLDEVPGWEREETPERLWWLTELVSTGGTANHPGIWEAEDRRLRLRSTWLETRIMEIRSGGFDNDTGGWDTTDYENELGEIHALLDLHDTIQWAPRPDVELQRAVTLPHRPTVRTGVDPVQFGVRVAIETRIEELGRRVREDSNFPSFAHSVRHSAYVRAWEQQIELLRRVLARLAATHSTPEEPEFPSGPEGGGEYPDSDLPEQPPGPAGGGGNQPPHGGAGGHNPTPGGEADGNESQDSPELLSADDDSGTEPDMPELLTDDEEEDESDLPGASKESHTQELGGLLPAYAVEYGISSEQELMAAQLQSYKGQERIWAGDHSPTQIFGDEHWVAVLLLFGGIGAELEGLLASGLKVRRVLYVDNDPRSRATFKHRLGALHHKYPDQLPLVAYHNVGSSLPWDIREVGERELVRCIGSDCNNPINLVTISSPCQGFSRANRQAQGLDDLRSGLIFEAWRVLSIIQRLQRPHRLEPGYIFEMVDASDHSSPPARWGFQQMELVNGGHAGSGIRVDAAKLGSAAHRTRVFWTNLAPAPEIQDRYKEVQRAQFLNTVEAQDVLDEFRIVQIAAQDDPAIPGYYKANIKGEPIRAFPTLVSTPGSYAFRLQDNTTAPGPGMVYDRNLREWQEPNADERERIMGMIPESTNCPGTTEEDRRRLIGAAVDVRGYTWLGKEIRRWRTLHLDE